MKKLVIFLIFLAYGYSKGNSIQLFDSTKTINISTKCLIFNDSLGKLSLEDIQKLDDSQFIQNEGLVLPYSNGVLWCKLSIENLCDKRFYLRTYNSALSYLDFYKINIKGELSIYKTGVMRPYDSREMDTPFFNFDISDAKNVYLKIVNDNNAWNYIPLSIYDKENIDSEINGLNILNGIYLGIFSLIVCLCIFNFIYLRELIYALYIFFAMSVFTLIYYENGFMNKYLFQGHLYLNNKDIAFAMWTAVFYPLFMMHFLQFKKYNIKALYVCYFVIALTLLTIIASVLGFNVLIISSCIVMFNQIMGLSMSIYIHRKGYRPARFFFVANLFVFIGSFLAFGVVFNSIPINFFTLNGFQICLIFEMIFFTLGLADKTYELKLSNEKAQKNLLLSLEENDKIIKDQNKKLEYQVIERTEEIESQNEELKQQQEELNSLNDTLNNQKHTIEVQNVELKNYSESLEIKVVERTSQIQQKNERLFKQNRLLEQYSYITSHNLRGPIARILGLYNVLDISDPSNPGNKQLLSHLNDTALALDSIVKDLSSVLNVNQDLNLENEEIELDALVDEILKSNDLNGVSIIKDFNDCPQVTSIKPYIHSIFYNLISNSVKYRSDSNDCYLKISSFEKDEKLHMIFEDNGIGMNLPLIGDKLFKAFQRFSPNKIDGKGMGLFLLKLQVEILEGEVVVESIPNVGTTITISLPIYE